MQVKELKESFEKLDAEGQGKGSFKAQRFTRAQARENEARGGAEEEDPPEDGMCYVSFKQYFFA